MQAMNKRVSEIEKQLKKYSISKKASEDLKSISSNIKERINILNGVHSELISISEELYYYDMIDYLGNLKIESLTLKQCFSIYKELEKARIKFVTDKDDKYTRSCDRISKRLITICFDIGKRIIKNRETNPTFIEFFSTCPNELKDQYLKYYFADQKKKQAKVLEEISENLDRTWEIFILGELTQFTNVFGEDSVEKDWDKQLVSVDCLNGFCSFLYEIFETYVFNSKNEVIASYIYDKICNCKDNSVVEKIFVMIFKLFKNSINKNRYFIKSQTYIEL